MKPRSRRSACAALWLGVAAFVLNVGWLTAATSPLPIPTRPASFPLSRPATIGKVVAWGSDSDDGWPHSTMPTGLSGVVAIAAGYARTVASMVVSVRLVPPQARGRTAAPTRSFCPRTLESVFQLDPSAHLWSELGLLPERRRKHASSHLEE